MAGTTPEDIQGGVPTTGVGPVPSGGNVGATFTPEQFQQYAQRLQQSQATGAPVGGTSSRTTGLPPASATGGSPLATSRPLVTSNHPPIEIQTPEISSGRSAKELDDLVEKATSSLEKEYGRIAKTQAASKVSWMERLKKPIDFAKKLGRFALLGGVVGSGIGIATGTSPGGMVDAFKKILPEGGGGGGGRRRHLREAGIFDLGVIPHHQGPVYKAFNWFFEKTGFSNASGIAERWTRAIGQPFISIFGKGPLSRLPHVSGYTAAGSWGPVFAAGLGAWALYKAGKFVYQKYKTGRPYREIDKAREDVLKQISDELVKQRDYSGASYIDRQRWSFSNPQKEKAKVAARSTPSS